MFSSMLRVIFFWILAISLFSEQYLGAMASLYPTKPVASTTYTAGQPAEVTWIEDGRKPLMNATIGFKIDLYAGNKTYIATLSKDSNPRSLYTTVYMPLSVPANFNHFTLHFIISQPPQIIYTADFNILPNPYKLPDSSSSRVASSSQAPSVTTVTSTIISRITGSQSVLPSSTNKASKGVPRIWALGGRRPSPLGGRLDVEKIKFRLVFMVWPALIGLSMAF